MRHIRQIVPAGLGLLALAAAAPSFGQEAAGGVWLRFSLDQSLSVTDNAALAPTSAGRTVRADTRLGVSLSSQTRNDRIALDLGASLRHVDDPNPLNSVDFGLKSPSAALRYSHDVGTARFGAGINTSVEDISFLRSQALILPALADEDAPEDPDTPVAPEVVVIEELDTGRRRTTGANASLRFGIGSPTELGVAVNTRAVSYSGTSGTAYADSRTHGINTDIRLALATDTTLTARLGYRLFEEDGGAPRETWTLGTTLSRRLTDGSLGASLNLVQGESGTRARLGTNWSLSRPAGRVALDLGVSRSAAGDLEFSGSASWNRNLPATRIGANLRTGFGADSDDEEVRFTNISAQVARDLGPLTSVNFNVSYASSQTTGGGAETRRASVGAGLSHQLDEDWALNLNYRRTHLRESGSGWAQSDTVSLSVGRSLSVRY